MSSRSTTRAQITLMSPRAGAAPRNASPRYDWSDPNRIVMTTVDSNVWGGDSGHTYTLTPQPDGRTAVDAVVVRDGKNLKGRFLGVVLMTVGRGVLPKAFANTIKAIEARNEAT